MKKISLLLVAMISLIIFSTTIFAEMNSPAKDNANEVDEVKRTVEKYFDNYFQSFVTLEQIPSSDFVEDNDNTYLHQKMHENKINFYKNSDLGYEEYKLSLNYKYLSIRKKIARVKLVLDVDYRDKMSDTDSGAYNNNYTFNLRYKQDKWFITRIETHFDDQFSFFKSNVEKVLCENIDISIKEAINRVSSRSLNNIEKIKKNEKEFLNKKNEETIKLNNETTDIKGYAITSSIQPGYDSSTGISYARRFAKTSEKSRLFYTASDNDCTNFVSQCVWAAYGGYAGNGKDSQTKSNISNKVRMVNTGDGYNSSTSWYGGLVGGGGVSNWENVESLWDFATNTSKSNGPKAVGKNNNDYYYNMNTNDIKLGSVLQFYNPNEGHYGHSVYVTKLSSNPYYIRVCQHTNDLKDRPLRELINYFGYDNFDDDCKMRVLIFTPAFFDK